MALKKTNECGRDNNANAHMRPRNEKQQHICIKQKILLMFLIISISVVSILMISNFSYSADRSSTQKSINKNDTFNGYTLNDKEQAIFKALMLEDYFIWTNKLGHSALGAIWAPMEKDIAALNKIVATADQIQNDYDGNEMAGDRKYQGKTLFFSGVVESINRGAGKNYYISLVGGNNKSIHPQAHMAEGYEEYLASLEKGEMVDLVCQGSGILKGVAIVDQCFPRYDWIYNWMQKQEINLSKLMHDIPEISETLKKSFAIQIVAVALTLPELSSCYVAGSNIKKCEIEINSALKNKIDKSVYKDAARKLKINYAELKENMDKEKQKVTSNGVKHTSGKSETAVDWYEKAMALWDDKGEKYNDPGKAIEYFSKAIKLKPDYADAYMKRGYTYLKQGNSKLGCSDARKACELGNCQVLEWAKSTTVCPRDNQDYAMDYFNRGQAYQKLQNIRRAIESYTEAIRLNPHFAAPYYNRGGIYMLEGLTQLAIEDFSKVISIKPNVVMGYEARGSIYLEQGNYKLCCPDAQKACELGNCEILKKAQSKGQCR